MIRIALFIAISIYFYSCGCSNNIVNSSISERDSVSVTPPSISGVASGVLAVRDSVIIVYDTATVLLNDTTNGFSGTFHPQSGTKPPSLDYTVRPKPFMVDYEKTVTNIVVTPTKSVPFYTAIYDRFKSFAVDFFISFGLILIAFRYVALLVNKVGSITSIFKK